MTEVADGEAKANFTIDLDLDTKGIREKECILFVVDIRLSYP